MIGYMGIVMLLWMYILGTKSVMGLIFHDLAPVLHIHKWLGKYGTIAIFLHPILITLSCRESWLYALIPKTATVTDRHILLGQIAFWVLFLTWVISFFLRKKMAFRPWKYMHYLAYVCVPFALLHVPDLGSQEQKYLAVKVYFFSLVLTYLVFAILRLRSWLDLDKLTYDVVRHVQLTDIDYMVRLRPIGDKRITPKRGQYVYVKLGFLSEDHPFTVTQHDEENGELTLAYRIAGMYIKELRKLTEDTRVLLSGPYGRFMEDLPSDDARPVVYLAGGIGITPFVEKIMKESDTREQWLFAANRTKDLAILYEPLKSRLGNRAVAIYSRDQSDMRVNEEYGYITYDLLKKYIPDPSAYQYYICGPQAMIASMTSMLTANGVLPQSIHSEKFSW